MSAPWFGPKSNGIGYAPANWKGWVALASFVVVVIAGSEALLVDRHAVSAYVVFMFLVIVAFLGLVVYKSHGSRPSDQ